MNPVEFKEFCNKNREAFFKKHPKPSKSGPRAYWKQCIQHADNAIEDNFWQPEVFADFASRITHLLQK